MMEFEKIRKVWDEQKGETMYIINETVLHKCMTRKKDAVSRRINRIEIKVSLLNGILAIMFFIIAIVRHPLIFFSSGLMAATVAYIQYFRWKRKKTENTFDRSMLGELDHAISNSDYIIRFKYFILIYLISFAIITISQLIIRGDTLWEWLVATGAFLMSFFIVLREQKVCNLPRKKQLLALKTKLMEK